MSLATELRVLPAIDLHFPVCLPGFRGAHHFRLEPLGQSSAPNPFGRLVALEPVVLGDGSLAEMVHLVVAAPGLLWLDYVVELDDSTEALLDLDDPRDAAALVIITIGETIEASTANLFAPIVLNAVKHLATQLLPPAGDQPGRWPINAPLPLAPLGW